MQRAIVVVLLAVFVSGGGPTAPVAAPCTCDPVTTALWHFDEGAGVSVTDACNGAIGTFTGGGLWWTTGCHAGDFGLALDGGDDEGHVEVNDAPAFDADLAQEFTVEAWVWVNDYTPITVSHVASKWGSGGEGNDTWDLYIWGGSSPARGKLEFKVSPGQGDPSLAIATTGDMVPLREWVLVRGTWKRNATSHVYVYDACGSLLTTGSDTTPDASPQDTDWPVWIGNGENQKLNGRISSLRISRTVRTDFCDDCCGASPSLIQITSDAATSDRAARWSPTGDSLAISREDTSTIGRKDVVVVAFTQIAEPPLLSVTGACDSAEYDITDWAPCSAVLYRAGGSAAGFRAPAVEAGCASAEQVVTSGAYALSWAQECSTVVYGSGAIRRSAAVAGGDAQAESVTCAAACSSLSVGNIAVSPDGRALALTAQCGGNTDLWMAQLTPCGDLLRLARVTDDPAVDRDPTWSPDGLWLAFESNRGGSGQIWATRALPGGEERGLVQLTDVLRGAFNADWSPDGDWIAFIASKETAPNDFDVWAVQVSMPTTSVPSRPEGADDLTLFPGAPNPFRSSTRIAYHVLPGHPVRIHVYDVQGRRVRTLVDRLSSGELESATWDGRDGFGRRVAPGVYLFRLESSGRSRAVKTILAR